MAWPGGRWGNWTAPESQRLNCVLRTLVLHNFSTWYGMLENSFCCAPGGEAPGEAPPSQRSRRHVPAVALDLQTEEPDAPTEAQMATPRGHDEGRVSDSEGRCGMAGREAQEVMQAIAFRTLVHRCDAGEIAYELLEATVTVCVDIDRESSRGSLALRGSYPSYTIHESVPSRVHTGYSAQLANNRVVNCPTRSLPTIPFSVSRCETRRPDGKLGSEDGDGGDEPSETQASEWGGGRRDQEAAVDLQMATRRSTQTSGRRDRGWEDTRLGGRGEWDT
ncbi:hypothetical protein L227DRAFT_565011 [Lentinus tigrinus ALCF2SS1-6]|uniref:Uncharacterized protein n=1 Tax=Lentinus tigrinus ALCF2SS1-6 TaxID=1328759 RepID=A0A5C2S544_9APHY|nr:hypothetical protein L227DRAFT_565011 [Lentinus tigrinus ALCF2SS1-6]